MARLRSLEYGTLWLDRLLEEPDGGDPARNGPYRGKLPVRQLAPGVCGADLHAGREAPRHGQLWRMGPLLVRVVQVTDELVRFIELTHGRNMRSMRHCDFVRRAHRKAKA